MAENKPQIVIEYYDPSEKIIEGRRIDPNNTYKKFREKGMNVEEFKKAIRNKFGDSVDIVNHAKKRNDSSIPSSSSDSFSRKNEDDRFSSRDIREAMRNDSMKSW